MSEINMLWARLPISVRVPISIANIDLKKKSGLARAWLLEQTKAAEASLTPDGDPDEQIKILALIAGLAMLEMLLASD